MTTTTTVQARAFLPPDDTIPALQTVLEDAIRNDPRTLQVALGPSEIGCACDRCLITMLAGHGREEYAAWMPTIGNAVHEWAEWAVINHLAQSGTDRYITEGKVTVGQVGGVDITGHADLFDVHTGTVVDYKLVGTTTLRQTKKDGTPKVTYIRQAQMYGRGYALAGYDVRSVAIWMLPRNGFTIGAGWLHQEPYNEQVAVNALKRADMFHGAIRALGVDAVLELAPPHTGEEFSCPRSGTGKQLDGLIAPTTP